MDSSRLASLLLSICLHAGVLALVLLWPAPTPKPVDLGLPVFDLGPRTLGAPGRSTSIPKAPDAPLAPGTEKPVAGGQDKPLPEQPKPDSQDLPVPPDTRKEPPKPATPKPEPPKPQPEDIPIPPEKPEPAKPDPPKPVERPKPEPPKPEPPKPEPAKPEPPKPVTKPVPKETPEDVLRRALADVSKNATRSGGGSAPDRRLTGKQGQDLLNSVLGDLAKSAGSGTDAHGDGPGGSGGDGKGILGTYGESVKSRIQPNWAPPPRMDRRVLRARVQISIPASGGSATDAKILDSSGDTAFDNSVLRAIRDTTNLERPPGPEFMEMIINFDSSELQKR